MYKCERCGSKLYNNYPYTKSIHGHHYIKCGHCNQWHEEVLDYIVKKCEDISKE